MRDKEETEKTRLVVQTRKRGKFKDFLGYAGNLRSG